MFSQYQFSVLLISIFSIALLKYFEIENFHIRMQVRDLYLNFSILKMRILRPSERKCYLEAELGIHIGFLFLSPRTFSHLHKVIHQIRLAFRPTMEVYVLEKLKETLKVTNF